MKIHSLKLVCFSPTGTTKSIIQAVARGIQTPTAELTDITRPEARRQPLQTGENELLVVAVPVYVGRVPALLLEWLHAIEARHTPVVCIVVYGNREYEDALIELKDILTERGCVPVACAAYIGEHSFSNTDTPIAEARPDAGDLNHAEQFGRQINQTLLSVSSSDHIPDLNVPGNHPDKDADPLLSVDFIAIGNNCLKCGVCAEECPVGAISPENNMLIDEEKCILCCACIKGCPENAREMKNGPVKDIAKRLSEMCKSRKEPALFF